MVISDTLFGKSGYQGLQTFQIMKQSKSRRETQGNQFKCPTFRLSQFIDSNSNIEKIPRLPFADRRNRIMQHPSRATIKISTKRTLGQSTRFLRDRSTAIPNINRLVKLQSSDFASLITAQLRKFRARSEQAEGVQPLKKIFQLSQAMNEEVYSYKAVESKMEEVHQIIKTLGSSTLIYRAFAFSAQCFYEYGSYSLSLFYFDRTFKCFYDRDDTYFLFQKQLQLQLYKSVTRIFLAKTKYIEAKNFALKLLRKSWLLGDADEEIAAYDLLGKVYMELQQISMSRYFHYRMASGEREKSDIVAMSGQEMGKESREKMQFVCYETINIFVDKDGPFNDILQNHYRMRSLEHAKEQGFANQAQHIYIYTHHSPNRQLNNYHLLERKMIEARNSKEIHFVRPRDSHRIRKIFSQFSAIIHQVIHKFEGSFLPTQRTLAPDTN